MSTPNLVKTAITSLLLSLCSQVAPAHAAPVVFNDRAAFDLALGLHESFGFDTIDPCPVFNPSNFTCTQSYGPVWFSFDIAGVPQGPDALALGVGGQSVGTGFSSPVRALGFDLVGGTPGSTVFLQFWTDTGDSLAASLTGQAFFGIVAGIGEELATWNLGLGPLGSQPVALIDNLAVQSAQQSVPEPATVGLFAVGLVLVASRWRPTRLTRP